MLYLIYVALGLVIYFWLPAYGDYGDMYQEKALNLLAGNGIVDNYLPKDPIYIPAYSLMRFWEDNGLMWGIIRTNQPTAFWEPGYILWLALWIVVFDYNFALIHVLQILGIGLVIPLVYYIAAQAYNLRVGVIAGLFLVSHHYLLRFPDTFPSENLFIPLFVGGIGAWYWCKRSPSILKVFIFSVIWSFAGLTRMAGIYLAILAVILLYLSTPKVRKYFLIPVIVFALCWGAWIYRNAMVVDEARLFPTKTGINLWAANNRVYLHDFLKKQNERGDYPDLYSIPPENEPILKEVFGLSDIQIRQLRSYDYPLEAATASEVEIDHLLTQRFNLFFWDHPRIVLSYSLHRLWVSFTENLQNLGNLSLQGIESLYFLILFIFGFIGLTIAIWNLKESWFLVILTLFYFLLLAGGQIGFRKRIPIDPILAIFAGLTMWQLAELVKARLKKRESALVPHSSAVGKSDNNKHSRGAPDPDRDKHSRSRL